MTGAEYLCQILRDNGVTMFCGIPGTDTTDIYNVCESFGIHPVVVRNELFAPMVADGYARVSRKPGVVISIPGPGALDMCSGLLEAYHSSVPILAIATDIPMHFRNRNQGYLHETKNLFHSFGNVSEQCGTVYYPDQMDLVYKYLHNMKDIKPSPYVVTIPSNLYQAECPKNTNYQKCFLGHHIPTPEKINLLINCLVRAERPVIIAGAGVWWSDACKELKLLAQKLSAPVFTSTNGKGVFSELHSHGFGQLIGEPEMQELLMDSDCVLALGTRWSDRSTDRWSLKLPKNIIEVNISEECVGKNYEPKEFIQTDIKMLLEAALPHLPSVALPASGWLLRFCAAKRIIRNRLVETNHREMWIVETLRNALPLDTILVNDSTTMSYWTRRYFCAINPGTFLWPMGSGTIGWGLPAAIGAALAVRERGSSERVVVLAGDGGLQYSLPELGTMMQEHLPIITILFDDSAYGTIRHFQNKRHDKKTPATKLVNPDFRMLTQSYGIRYRRIWKEQDFEYELIDALHTSGPTLIHYQGKLEPPERL